MTQHFEGRLNKTDDRLNIKRKRIKGDLGFLPWASRIMKLLFTEMG